MILIASTPLTATKVLTLAGRLFVGLLPWALLSGCAVPPAERTPRAAALPIPLHQPADFAAWHRALDWLQAADALLLGEQHDALMHHQWEADTVRELAARQRLAALVLEMADAGTPGAPLPSDASEDEVQKALNWNDKGWPWKHYGRTVMTAVRAGVPVRGGNLPREAMRAAMQDERLDTQLSPAGMQMQMQAIRDGHCDLLPESQWLPMARIQLARDDSMAKVIRASLQPAKVVLLVAGGGHVRRDIGVPQWLKGDGLTLKAVIARSGVDTPGSPQQADLYVTTPPLPPRDHCAELRQQWKR